MKEKKKLFSVTKKDLDITFYSGSGGGGQHRNKHQNCVRMKHPPSGVTVTAGEQRSRIQNLKMAFKRLTENKKFLDWLKLESCKVSGILDDIECQVNKSINNPNNLKYEVKENGKWVEKNLE